ncbi:prephenate dehydratase [Salinimicrobium sp. TH3]|uniref:prephenate dehydratase n=1 Tax=Salinimicrobium sp. TH3 TaxID=2997342 RepID=UPI002274E59E|nr:prephenate dehydratase [Salinimicrobium sp. TH3]MCY2686052.1 prephenate dehydratase [Salinimicrobium sp. TH3]
MEEKIAIQGIKGSFHHQVALEYFGEEVPVDECQSFREVVDSLLNNRAISAVMAIENSTAGTILPNYALIDENNLQIKGEHYIPIFMNLMVLPGQKISEIKKVCSHPMALLQCQAFFKEYPHIELIEDTDTADVAKRISEHKLKGVAAVASKAAARIYGLEILNEGIQTMKSNSTRFLVLSSKNAAPVVTGVDKASLKFVLENKRGSLVSVLNILRDFDLDMTKIQSVPVVDIPWKYAFFIDVLFQDEEEFQKVLEILSGLTEELKVLGIYKNGLL